MVLHITGSMTKEYSTVQINTGKYYELLKDNKNLDAKKYFNRSSVSIGERTKKEYVWSTQFFAESSLWQ